MRGVDAAKRSLERHPYLNHLVVDRNCQIHGLAIGVLQRDREREIERLAGLLKTQNRRLTRRTVRAARPAGRLDTVRERYARQRAVVDPAFKESLERAAGRGLHGLPEVFRPGLGEA